LFLTEEDIRAEEQEANKDVIVDEALEAIKE
jgi:hypothetical protein